MSDQMDAPEGAEFYDQRWGQVDTATSTPSVTYINESGLPDELVHNQMRENKEIASVIERWSQQLRAESMTTTNIDIFNRHKWNGARHQFSLMSQCAWAVENDEILSTLADVTEGLAFNKCRFEMFDNDQEDVWNQWAAEVDLDSRLREMFRELYKVSQVYVGIWWERRTYPVRESRIEEAVKDMKDKLEAQQAEEVGAPAPDKKGPGRGNRSRKRKFTVEVPTAFTIFDPTKVLPVGLLMFGRERFAYIADDAENDAFAAVLRGDVADSTVLQLVEGKYVPTKNDIAACGELGVDYRNLWLLKEDAVFRHTLTKSQYERFAPVRLRSILPILEMKGHLRNSDRATLIGNTNFIVVITKGTDKLPAKPSEIENLREQARVVARLPILVGDHRLNVQIVSPAMDNTLIESRWQVLDSRLVFRALATFQPIVQGGNSSGSGVSEMSRVVSRGLENRRHLLMRTLEKHVFQEILNRNASVLDEEPNLEFTPKRVALDYNNDVVQAILKLRDRGDVSRETTLEELDFDQDVEVRRRAQEKVLYDRVFQSGTPFSSPQMNPYAPQQPGEQPGQGMPPKAGEKTNGPKQSGDLGRPPGVTEKGPRKPSNA